MKRPAVRLQALLAAPLAGLCLCACGSGGEDDDPVVARAYESPLHWSDLRQIVPVGTAPEDSAALAHAYVNNWLRQQVELHHAEKNLSAGRKGFEAELRDYRNSLLLHAFEEQLVSQRLDTVISPSEIEAFYQANNERFDLGDDLLRARWFHVRESDNRALRKMEDRFMSGRPNDMHELELALAERGVPITDRGASWTTLTQLRDLVPIDALPAVPADGKRTVLREEGGAWFLDLLELRPRLSPAPIELVRQEIRSILLNQRKLELIERMRDDLYHEALANDAITAP